MRKGRTPGDALIGDDGKEAIRGDRDYVDS